MLQAARGQAVAYVRVVRQATAGPYGAIHAATKDGTLACGTKPHEKAITALRAHKARQDREREAAGASWQGTNLVSCHEDGSMYRAKALNWRFGKMTRKVGIGHWHAHEGRQTAVSIMSSNGVPIQDINDTVAALRAASGLPSDGSWFCRPRARGVAEVATVDRDASLLLSCLARRTARPACRSAARQDASLCWLSGSGSAKPFGGLTGDGGDEVEVFVAV